jgi:hypothetical protein
VSAIFPKLEGLDSLARRDGVDIRPTLVRVLTDLYVQKAAHSAEEERHYTELVLRLIDSVDLATRVAVARKIGGYPGAPPAVARRLARDSIEVAEPILRQSGALGSADLAAIVRDFGPSHAAIIAAREIAKPQQRLVAEPPKAPRVERPARDNTDIGIADLFFSADPAARRTLLLSLGNADSEAAQSVRPLETLRALESAALARDPIGFTTLIESALSLTRAQAERFVHDPSGEPLLVAAKALAMPPVVLQRVLMFIDPAIGESVARVFDLAAFYERMSADAAHKIIDSVRGREPVRTRKPQPQHRPMYYDDETGRSRRAGATRRVGTPAETQTPIRVEPGKTQRTM